MSRLNAVAGAPQWLWGLVSGSWPFSPEEAAIVIGQGRLKIMDTVELLLGHQVTKSAFRRTRNRIFYLRTDWIGTK